MIARSGSCFKLLKIEIREEITLLVCWLPSAVEHNFKEKKKVKKKKIKKKIKTVLKSSLTFVQILTSPHLFLP